MPDYTFLPWVRPDLQNLPADTMDATLPAAVRTRVELTLNGNAPIAQDLLLDGPGDVIGLDPRSITRMEPAPGTVNFESNYLAAIEFARPDLPWLFTPARATPEDRLRPWLVLAVVRKQPDVALLRPERQLPILQIKSGASRELPDLSQSWAWAHAQVNDRLEGDLHAAFQQQPRRFGSRLLCPRRLSPDTGYYACLVPAFEAGRLAGLGQPAGDVTSLAPAWAPDAGSVTLPVYHVWEFATGAGGDFESLCALLLEPKPGAGEPPPPRIVDASGAGTDLPAPTATSRPGETEFALECPLVPLGAERTLHAVFADRMRTALREALAPSRRGDPRITAPVYGSTYVADASLGGDSAAPQWLKDLNLDPRFRTSASFGAEVVRRNQDRLADSAWDQAGDIQDANQLIRHVQAAAAAAAAIHRRHFSRLSDSALLEITRPLHARLAINQGETFQAMLAKSNTPPALASAEFRRVARPRGPTLRVAAAPAERSMRPFIRDVSAARLTLRFVRANPPIATPEATETRCAENGNRRPAGQQTASFALVYTFLAANIPQRPFFSLLAPALPGPPVFHAIIFQPGITNDSPAAARFREALGKHQPLLGTPPTPILIFHPATVQPVALQLADARKLLDARIAPTLQFSTAVQGFVAQETQTPPLAQRRVSPTFSEPLYAALAEISPDLVVQGFETIGPNTITPLETNGPFVEAFLAGANHELERELLWREFPLEARTTFFQTFWDAGRQRQPDVPPLAAWPPATKLGENTTASSRAVFLIRGELLRRYPTAIVYLMESGPADTQGRPTLGGRTLAPVIRGTLSSDAGFFGFEVSPDEVVGDPGWLFVIEEPPSEPRFGVEVDVAEGALEPGATAARTAEKYIQKPVRFVIHARDLLPAAHG